MANPQDHVPPYQASGEVGDDDESLQHLFYRYYSPIVSFFANRGVPREECQDLAQETFLRIFRGMRQFRGEASFETWLFRIAVNVWRNALRDRSTAKRQALEIALDQVTDDEGTPSDALAPAERATTIVDRATSSTVLDPLDDLLEGEKVNLLRQAIDDLPLKMQRCVLLRVGQDLTYREIAAVMNITVGTVKSRLHAARTRLTAKLGHAFPDIDA